MNKDLTVGRPESVLWRFCLPMFASVIFQQLYNIADSLIAGKFIGENALAAIGNSYEITLIFMAFAIGSNMGCSIIVSRLFGEKDYGRMKSAVSTAWIAGAVLVGTLTVLGLVFCDGLLALIKTPAEVFSDSKLYLDIYVWGLPFLFFYNISTGIFSALGDSKTPFRFLAVSSVANIIMDVVCVNTFNMGIAGLAWATFICQGISCVLAVWTIIRRLKSIPTEGRHVLFDRKLMGQIAAVAVPSILQQSFVSVGNIAIQGIINSFGPAVMAGYSAGVKLNNLVITSLTTMGNGISNYTAQNIGAAKPERIRAGHNAGIKMVWLICLPVFVLYFFGTRFVLGLFMETPTEGAMATGLAFLRIVAPCYFIIAVKMVSDGILRGSGRMKEFMVCTFSDLILRVALAAVLSKTALGSLGIWCAWPIGWAVGTLLSQVFYRRGPWCRAAAVNVNEEA
ncbi:MAG: MATE family efflux transporter [Clostridia bacterium]|nr:MATE family efflux transporter [Clostridia bacterium]